MADYEGRIDDGIYQLDPDGRFVAVNEPILKQFAYAGSHDLREPLRMVSSYLKLLESRHDDALDADYPADDSVAADRPRRPDPREVLPHDRGGADVA